MKHVWVVALATMLIAGCASTPERTELPGDPQMRFENVNASEKPQTIQDLLESRGVPGVSVAVIRNGEIAWSAAYGIADVSTGDPVTPETLFQAASISKPVAAMVALTAVRDGAFSLDDDINLVLKSWKLPEHEWSQTKPVTPRMLLSHTGGTTVHGYPGYAPGAAFPTVPQLLSGIDPANTDPVIVDIEPGTQWRYSGGGTTIVQLAVSDALQQPFHELARARVLQPCGMINSGYDQPLPTERDRFAARAHDGRGEAQNVKWHVYPELQAAGLWTTPTDLCRFAIEVMRAERGESDRVLTPQLARLMVAPTKPGNFGLGLAVFEFDDGRWAGHGGSNWGFRCNLDFNLDTGDGYCIMTNSDSGSVVINELRRRLVALYGWREKS